MESCRQISVNNQTFLCDGALPPSPSGTNEFDRKLAIAVVFTSAEATAAAIDHAAALLTGLNGHISLVSAQTVPYAVPLENPPVSLEFSKRQLLEIAHQSPVETSIHLYLCRLRYEMLASVLKPGSLVVMGCRKGWWPTWEKSLARKLQSNRYQVILLETP